MKKIILVEISARHIHLSKEDSAVLFGQGYELRKEKALSQPGQFAAKETVDLLAGDKKIARVRVLGPFRPKTQLEISLTDAFNLGLSPFLNQSGFFQGGPAVFIIGQKGRLKFSQGNLIALRHIHISPSEAKKFGLKQGDSVSVKIAGPRSLTLHNIRVGIDKDFRASLHLDADEGNAAGLTKKGSGEIV